MSNVFLVGCKNAALDKIIRQLTPKGIHAPGRFTTIAYAYRYFIQQAGGEIKLRQSFRHLDVENLNILRSR